MSNKPSQKVILTKAIEKAVAGGWRPFKVLTPIRVQKWQKGGMVHVAVLNKKYDREVEWFRELEGIIFDHDFAKALWGEDRKSSLFYDSNLARVMVLNWQAHLMEMVIAEDPIEYLRENI